MVKHKFEIPNDYNFLLIGISSHEKDYRVCWAINKKFKIELAKKDSLEIKGKKQTTLAYFSFYEFIDQSEYLEYFVVANISENKPLVSINNTLFPKDEKSKNKVVNEMLIPEQKQMDYFFMLKGEVDEEKTNQILKQIKEIDVVQTAIIIDVSKLKSKVNLIF